MAFEHNDLHEAERTELCLSLDHRRKAQKVAPVYIFIIQQALSVAGLYT